MRTRLAVLIVGAIVLSATGACRRGQTPGPTPVPGGIGPTSLSGAGGKGLQAPEPTPGVRFRLSDAAPAGPPAAEGAPAAAATPLSDAQVADLLARLPALPEATAQQASFALKPGPKPPVRTGQTIQQPFPPPATSEAPPSVAVEPLQVQRYQPEGDVDQASHLAVTFSLPMVPLTSHATLAAAGVPVKLNPQPKGQWRWVGTQTLLFEPELRFPMATEYQAEVPAGTKSATGGALAQAVRWTFRTPPPTVVTSHPTKDSGSQQRQPLIFIAFDQKVDPSAVVAHTTLKVAGDGAVNVRQATPAEAEADDTVRQMGKDAIDGRWVALRPVDPLPVGAAVTVSIPPGLPSAEGPRTTEKEQTFQFDVYGPLKVVRAYCGGPEPVDVTPARAGIAGCEPLTPWGIDLSNSLDMASFDPKAIVVTPELPSQHVEAFDNTIGISGLSKGRTEYTVRLPGTLKDQFGQTLGADVDVTFTTGDAKPALYTSGGRLVVLDPSGDRALSVSSINNDVLKVRLYRVQPSDWPAFVKYADAYQSGQAGKSAPPGILAWSGSVQPKGERDAIVTTPIDLTPALTDGLGQVVAIVEPPKWSPDDQNWQNRPILQWVQSTQLGLDVFQDQDTLATWVTALKDGAPLNGAQVTQEPTGQTGVTDGDGRADLKVTASGPESTEWERTMVVARKDGDVAILPAGAGYNPYYGGGAGETLTWFVFDDRGLYLPGEDVHIKGYLRRYDRGKNGDVAALGSGATAIHYKLTAPNGQEIGSGDLPLTTYGGFDGAFTLPKDVELGTAQLALDAVGTGLPADGRNYQYAVNIAEFRRPEFEVKATSEKPYYVFGDQGVVTAEATYYSGGPLPGADVTWSVSADATQFTPPGHDDFQFGPWHPWWGYGDFGPIVGPTNTQEHTGRTDATGQHRLAIDFDGIYPLSAASFQAQATVQDVNRQAWTGTTTFLVHPATYYVGLRAPQWFADPGHPLDVETIVADLDGKLVVGSPVQMTAERLDWVFRNGEYVEQPVPAGDCQVTSADTPVKCTFTFKDGGTYRVTAHVNDAQGRLNETQIELWVTGGQVPPQVGVQQQQVQLVPNANKYEVGDVAEILVQAPFAPAEGLLSIRRSGLVRTERFHMDGPSTTLKVPIEEAYIPNFTVQVDLVGSAPRAGSDGQPDPKLPPRPAYASGSIEVPVPPLVRTLTVKAAPRDESVQPGGSTTVDIAVTDADGKPLPDAEVALVVADEAVLGLTDYRIPDPIETFYPQRSPDVSDGHQRELVQLADPASLLSEASGGPGARAMVIQEKYAGSQADMSEVRGMGLPSGAAMMVPAPGLPLDLTLTATALANVVRATPVAPVTERANLNPLAAFEPALRTGPDGKVSVPVKLPDNVTRYRITAVGTDGAKRFGKGESTLTAQLPLTVRPSAPRFLNFGDTFELPIVVQNQTKQPLETDVVVRASNLKLTEGAGYHVTIPAEDRVEVRFPAAADMPGTAVIQAGAFSGDAADAQRVSLPVWTPATMEAFATYGQVDAGAIAQPVLRPTDAITEFGGLDLTESSTALSALTDAFLYLQSYPYEGAEQIASRVLATVALKDVLAAFGSSELPSPATVDAAVKRDIGLLAPLQNEDGGFGWWQPGESSDPFVTIHVAHALARAKEKGYDVGQDSVDRVKGYLVAIEQHLDEHHITGQARDAARAYALYTRMLLGDRDTAKARAVFAESKDPSVETLGWLLSVLSGDPASAAQVAEIRRQLNNRVSEEAGTAQFTTQYDEQGGNLILASDRRADAVVLDALMTDQPQSDLIPKLVSGLLDHRTQGRWGSTQENAWVLLALDRYFRIYEAQTPAFVARAWLGDGYLGDSTFTGRTANRTQLEVPMSALPEGGPQDLVLAKDGAGRLYYRLGMRYAPQDLVLVPSEHGFSVERTYEAVDNADDVKRLADGTWQIKAGSRVRVRLTMVAPGRRYQVALVDPLPAGLEALNPELAVTGSLPPDQATPVPGGPIPMPRLLTGPMMPDFGCCWWGSQWWDHDAFRDERTEVFSNLLDGGVYRYTYIARATTPGEYVVPPTKAEEMYHPETFGRAATEKVVVK
jgi:alpha-2-macroglobulin